MPELLSHLSNEDFAELRRLIEETSEVIAADKEESKRFVRWLVDIIRKDPRAIREALGVMTDEDKARASIEGDARSMWKLAHHKRHEAGGD